MRSVLLVLLVLSTGCKTTGGKVFGTTALVSAVAGSYLMVTSSTTIENERLVMHDDRQNAGVGLVFAAVAAAGAWAVSEMIFGEHSGGGGGGYLLPPAEPAVEPAIEPAVEPAAVEVNVSVEPTVIVVQDRDRGPDERDLLSRGWRFDPGDGEHKFYAPSGEFIGRIDHGGDVWNASDSHMGRVDMSPGCGVACKRSQARKMLLGIPMNH
jgi:hypothetical protein